MELGTFIFPVDVFVIYTLSESKLPQTSPVEVFTNIAFASLPLKLTSPVERLISSFSVAITLSKKISPVPPIETRDLQFTPFNLVLPVETPRLISPVQTTSVKSISPVSVFAHIELVRISLTEISPVLSLNLTVSAFKEYEIIKQKMEEMRAQGASQGRASVEQQLQQGG